MATHNLTLGQSIAAAISAGAAGDTYNFASGTYHGQTFTPKTGDFYKGDPGGGTILSGGWLITSWSNVSGNWNKATAGNGDLFTGTTLPFPINTVARFTGSSTGTTLTVASTQSGTVAVPGGGGRIYGNGVADNTEIVSGSAPTWTISPSQSIGAGTKMIMISQGYENAVNSAAPSDPNAYWTERLWVDGVLYTRITCAATPAAPGANQWYLDMSDNSININLASPGSHTIEYTCSGQCISFPSINNVTLSNFTIQKYGYFQQAAVTLYGSYGGWSLQNMTFNQNTMGANISAGVWMITGGHYVDNFENGIIGSPIGGSITGAEVARNNANQVYNIGWQSGGIKLTLATNFSVIGNNVHDNGGPGVWTDINCVSVDITNNIITGNASNGIQYEISSGPSCIAYNTISGNSQAGIYISNSNGVDVTHNNISVPIGNNGSGNYGGIVSQSASRGDSTNTSHDNQFHNNTITYLDNAGAHDGTHIYSNVTQNLYYDFNTYYTPNGSGTWWARGSDTSVNTNYTWSALQAAGFEPNSTNVVGVAPGALLAPSPTAGYRTMFGQVTLVALDISTVTTGGTAVNALSAGHCTAGGRIQNPPTAAVALGVNQNGTASGTASNGSTVFIQPGATCWLAASANAVSVISSDSSHAFAGEGWQ